MNATTVKNTAYLSKQEEIQKIWALIKDASESGYFEIDNYRDNWKMDSTIQQFFRDLGFKVDWIDAGKPVWYINWSGARPDFTIIKDILGIQ